ncbi:MAG: elongation factor P maturation arginine rhamnosyltransferase EarP [Pseudomonadota bacterium]
MHQHHSPIADKPITCDIFCSVVDNYGDIGVSWRLAQQLAHEQGLYVRLWVDDLPSFRRLCPEAGQLAVQHIRGVDVRLWPDDFPDVQPAQLVIEMFACALPQRYLLAMASVSTAAKAPGEDAQSREPVWIALEHLSAEYWVADYHGLPSPHPVLSLIRYFFFPGFTPKTGGLLLERDLIARRDSFQSDPQAVDLFWQSLDIPPRQPDEMRLSLFCYEPPALPGLLAAWAAGAQPVLCLVPEGRALPQIAAFFSTAEIAAGQIFQRGNLQVRVLAFLPQESYDQLLWACDCNFVRGEDSFVRAQWAARPFVWHIYPQQDDVHLQKLHAFIMLYSQYMASAAAQSVRALWLGWNAAGGAGSAVTSNSAAAWKAFREQQPELEQHARIWARQLAENNLAWNLLDFYREKLIK